MSGRSVSVIITFSNVTRLEVLSVFALLSFTTNTLPAPSALSAFDSTPAAAADSARAPVDNGARRGVPRRPIVDVIKLLFFVTVIFRLNKLEHLSLAIPA
jgi:hypothetical protein